MTIDRLIEISEIVSKHGDPKLARWITAGVDEYLGGSDRRTLEHCLELKSLGRGQPSPRRTWAKERRDEALRSAFDLVEGNSPTAKCDALARHIRDFTARMWPRWQTLPEPPAGSSQLRCRLWDAAKTGEPLPTNWRRLWETIFHY